MAGGKQADEPKAPVLETFIPTVSFLGRPDAAGEEIEFRAGIESIPVPAEYAALIREKGLAPKREAA